MVSPIPQRPVLTPEERAALIGVEPHIAVIRSTLTDLHAIGFDASADLDLLDRTEAMRTGLLDKFSSSQITSPPRRARGK